MNASINQQNDLLRVIGVIQAHQAGRVEQGVLKCLHGYLLLFFLEKDNALPQQVVKGSAMIAKFGIQMR